MAIRPVDPVPPVRNIPRVDRKVPRGPDEIPIGDSGPPGDNGSNGGGKNGGNGDSNGRIPFWILAALIGGVLFVRGCVPGCRDQDFKQQQNPLPKRGQLIKPDKPALTQNPTQQQISPLKRLALLPQNLMVAANKPKNNKTKSTPVAITRRASSGRVFA